MNPKDIVRHMTQSIRARETSLPPRFIVARAWRSGREHTKIAVEWHARPSLRDLSLSRPFPGVETPGYSRGGREHKAEGKQNAAHARRGAGSEHRYIDVLTAARELLNFSLQPSALPSPAELNVGDLFSHVAIGEEDKF